MVLPPERQLAWFAQALDQLEAFLLSDDVFRPLAGLTVHPRPDLSLGAVFLAADFLGAAPLSRESEIRAERLLLKWEADAARHAAAVEGKALAEARQRANLWLAYVDEIRESPREASRYRNEVRHRVALERLLERLEGGESATQVRLRVQGADDRARAAFAAGPFVWEPFLESAYPRDRYWFLYGSPRASEG